jgi:hypothetical protein
MHFPNQEDKGCCLFPKTLGVLGNLYKLLLRESATCPGTLLLLTFVFQKHVSTIELAACEWLSSDQNAFSRPKLQSLFFFPVCFWLRGMKLHLPIIAYVGAWGLRPAYVRRPQPWKGQCIAGELP